MLREGSSILGEIKEQTVAILVRNDTFSRIEFKQAFVLSSDNTNYKNDIQ